ncbi:hypothetical protein RFI_30412, partial [Reticulomyxa filosa]
DEDIEGGLENLHLRDVPKPGPIDNSELADEEDQTQLKKLLDEHLTHEWLHEDQWKMLESWYKGGPAFPRKVYERGKEKVEGVWEAEKEKRVKPQKEIERKKKKNFAQIHASANKTHYSKNYIKKKISFPHFFSLVVLKNQNIKKKKKL